MNYRKLLSLPIAGMALMLTACGQETEISSPDNAASGAAVDTSVGCDRDCLNGVMDAYLAALVDGDPSAAPLADEVYFVENVTHMDVGEGLWTNAASISESFKIMIPDTRMQNAAYMGLMKRDDEQDLMVSIRLKLDEDEIVEAEHLVTTVDNMERLMTPRPGLLAEVPEASRISHEELGEIGMSYYDALDNNDGSAMPFADDCQRHENGMVTAGPEAGPGPNPNPDHPVARLCAPQLDSQSFVYIEHIENRRLAAADPVTGLALGFSHFRHSFKNLPYEVTATDGFVLERNAENMPYDKFDMPAAHLFKIGADGRVHEIEALGVLGVPFNATTGWEQQSCNRQCLIDLAQNYFSALAANDPSRTLLADNVRFVENLTPMSPGEGLWATATDEPYEFEVIVPDEVRQTVGAIGLMKRMAPPPAPTDMSAEERAEWAETADVSELPALVAIRLELEDGYITEAEHLVTGVRDNLMSSFDSPREGLVTNVPPGQRMDHESLITLGASYYDALDDNDGSLMPFAEDCERHENGMVTAGPNQGAGPVDTSGVARDCAGQLTSNLMNYITTIDNRRVFAADPVTGLVMGLSQFRHPMDQGPYEVTNMDGTTEMREMDFDPFDLPAAHIFKVGGDGLVHEIEAMGFMAPYNSPTGWE